MHQHTLRQDDLSLFYSVTGSGDPVLLIHGFGEDKEIWNTMIPGLENHHKLIIPDLVGSGRSTGNTEGITMESMAEHIKLILDNEKINTCTMIGHSMGGYITLAFAEKYPERLNRMGLFHSTAFADNEEKKTSRKKNMEFIAKHGSALFLEQSVPTLFSEEFSKQHPEKIKEIISRYSNFSASSLVHYTAAMMNRPDRIPVLKKFPNPVLFIMGEYDTAIPLEQGLKQCSIPEFSYIYTGTHSGHMGMMEEPEFCLNAIIDFLSGK